jgi:hypothetical protein
MKFTVTALESVDDLLAALFIESPDRQAVSDAANWIERELMNDPLDKVTSVDNLYFLRRDPLVALCKINVDDRLVTIVDIHRVEEA